MFHITDFYLIASLLLAALVYTAAKHNDSFDKQNEVKETTGALQNPETCLGSCPAYDPEDGIVLLQNKDCTKYCICGGGRATVNVCPEGLHFSLEEQVCTWPSDANCEDDVIKVDKGDLQFDNSNILNIFDEKPEATTESWRNPDTCKGYCPAKDPEDKTILLENNDCTKYCSCSNGSPIVNICPKGLHFSLKEQTCTWPRDAKCPQTRSDEPMFDWLHFPRDY